MPETPLPGYTPTVRFILSAGCFAVGLHVAVVVNPEVRLKPTRLEVCPGVGTDPSMDDAEGLGA